MKTIKNIIRVFFRDLKMLNKRHLSLAFRLFYPIKKYFALTRSLITSDKRIDYLGNRLNYDNCTFPISLQTYPYDVKYKILNVIDAPLKNVLDIGANIGQFAITLSSFSKKSRVFCFEPNPAAYALLLENTSKCKNIHTFNLGIGKNEESVLYHLPSKSATASLIEKNAIETGNDMVIRTNVKLTNEIYKLTSIKNFDLIKIDVEGYEFEVIKNLSVKTRYLFVEISGKRERDYSHSEIYRLIEDKFGVFDLIYSDSFNEDENNFEILLKFPKAFQKNSFDEAHHENH